MNAFKKLKAGKSVFMIIGLLLLIIYTISFLFPLFWLFKIFSMVKTYYQ